MSGSVQGIEVLGRKSPTADKLFISSGTIHIIYFSPGVLIIPQTKLFHLPIRQQHPCLRCNSGYHINAYLIQSLRCRRVSRHAASYGCAVRCPIYTSFHDRKIFSRGINRSLRIMLFQLLIHFFCTHNILIRRSIILHRVILCQFQWFPVYANFFPKFCRTVNLVQTISICIDFIIVSLIPRVAVE